MRYATSRAAISSNIMRLCQPDALADLSLSPRPRQSVGIQRGRLFPGERAFRRQVHKLLRPDDIIWCMIIISFPWRVSYARWAAPTGLVFSCTFHGRGRMWRAPAFYQRILRSFGAYDVVGFQTQSDADNFRDCITAANAGRAIDVTSARSTAADAVRAFPISIDSEAFAQEARAPKKTAWSSARS